MQTKFGFTSFTIAEFINWIAAQTVSRTILRIQEHHTFLPNYTTVAGHDNFTLQQNMKHHHVANNGWSDIGQNFSTFPDGTIMTGRGLSKTPACIFGNNSGSVCIENVGDFDTGRDAMTASQRDTIIRATAALAKKFNLLPVTVNNIVYHHWYDLNTGARTNGSGVTKSCPGTAFFGGNTVAACQASFLPLIGAALTGGQPAPMPAIPQKFVCVTAASLNLRTGPGTGNPLVPGQGPAQFGSVLRVHEARDGWYRISSSKQHWVSASRTRDVTLAVVNTDGTNCRSGPGTNFPIVFALAAGEQVFVHETRDGWSRVNLDQQWIKSTLLS